MLPYTISQDFAHQLNFYAAIHSIFQKRFHTKQIIGEKNAGRIGQTPTYTYTFRTLQC